jgi:hypothetical protein
VSVRADRRRPDIHPRDLPFVALLPLWATGVWALVHAILWPPLRVLGSDTLAYYQTAQQTHPYLTPPGYANAYLYSPAFAQAIHPLTLLPWHVFLALWMVAEAACFAWLLAPMGWRWGAPAFLIVCALEVTLGNINAFLAVAAVLGMRRPGFWAFPILTKVTPGLGPLWFTVRREWRALAWSLGVTALVAAVSYVAAPTKWSEWIALLRGHGGPGVTGFLIIRVLVGVGLTIYAAITTRPWLLPVAMIAVTPVWGGVPIFTMLAAVPRLIRNPQPSAAADDRPN